MKNLERFAQALTFLLVGAFPVLSLSFLVPPGFAQQQGNIAVVDKLFVEQGGSGVAYTRSLESKKRYKVDIANCAAYSGELLILVVEVGKGMGFYSNTGGWCLVKEMWPID